LALPTLPDRLTLHCAVPSCPARSLLQTAEERRAEAVSIHSYQVVAKRAVFDPTTNARYARPLVVVGPESLRITEAVIHVLPNVPFVHAVPHTTRTPRNGEKDGVDYFFISKEQMQEGLQKHKFIEAGRYKDNMYGTSLKSIRDPSSEGKVVIMDTQLKAVTRLQMFGDIHPVVVLLKPSSVEDLFQSLQHPAARSEGGEPPSMEAASVLYRATLKTEAEYGHLFTHVVLTGQSLATTVRAVANLVHHCLEADYWADTLQQLPTKPLDQASRTASPAPPSNTPLSMLSHSPSTMAGNPDGRQSPVHLIEGTTRDHTDVDAPLAQGPGSEEPLAEEDAEDVLLRNDEETAEEKALRRKKRARRGVTYAPVCVVLKRNANNSFGFSVAGGIEDDLLPAIVLKAGAEPIVLKGPTLHKGDEIVSVDGTSVAGLPHDQVIGLIKAAGEELTLMVFQRRGHGASKVTELVAMQPMSEQESALQKQVRALGHALGWQQRQGGLREGHGPAGAAERNHPFTVPSIGKHLQVKETLYAMTVPLTTRPPAQHEENGREYRFVSIKEFEQVRQVGDSGHCCSPVKRGGGRFSNSGRLVHCS
jgi:guanylate kinase